MFAFVRGRVGQERTYAHNFTVGGGDVVDADAVGGVHVAVAEEEGGEKRRTRNARFSSAKSRRKGGKRRVAVEEEARRGGGMGRDRGLDHFVDVVSLHPKANCRGIEGGMHRDHLRR